MKIENIKKILNGDIDLIDQVNIRDSAECDDCIVISPKHVRKMLLRFLKNDITADELTKWGRFISQRVEYTTVHPDINPMNPEFNEIADYYGDVWDIVHEVALPKIYYEITQESITGYLKRLGKYRYDRNQFFSELSAQDQLNEKRRSD